MAIMVGENYKIVSDRLNVILYSKDIPTDNEKSERMKQMWRNGKMKAKLEKVDDKNEDKVEQDWKVEGYYSNLINCYNALLRIEVQKTELVDVEKVLERIKEVEGWIKNSLSDNPSISMVASFSKGGISI